jgi:hypothetical protein
MSKNDELLEAAHAEACEAAGGEVTECSCGVNVCSIEIPAPSDSDWSPCGDDEPSQCRGFAGDGQFVDYELDPCVDVLCDQTSAEDVAAEQAQLRACEAAFTTQATPTPCLFTWDELNRVGASCACWPPARRPGLG